MLSGRISMGTILLDLYGEGSGRRKPFAPPGEDPMSQRRHGSIPPTIS